MKRLGVYLLIASAAILLPGCSKEQAEKLAKQATDSVKKSVSNAGSVARQAGDQVMDAAPGVAALVQSGSADLRLGKQPIQFAGAFCRIVNVSPQHGGVLQIRSYADIENERFPSFFFQANTQHGDLASLIGSDIQGQLFLQLEPNGPVWSTGPTPIAAQIQSVEGSSAVGRFVDGTLTSPDQKLLTAGGSFVAAIQD